MIDRLRGLARRTSRLTGWRRIALAFGAGAVSALSTAPFGVWPVLFLTFPVLVFLMDGLPPLSARAVLAALGIGWGFGFGYFLASLWWIGSAFLVEADVFAWLLPFAVVSLPAGLAVFPALGLAAAKLLWSRHPGRICALGAGLGGSEWLRGHVLTGFPWNTFGYALAENLALAQSAALVGLWGLTLAAILIFAAPALLLDPPRRKGRLLWPAVAGLVLVAAFGWGTWRLSAPALPLVEGVRLRIMQPALPQDQKFSYADRQRILDLYLDLSAQPSAVYPRGLADVTLLVWPESAFPFIYEREPWAPARIGATLPPGTILVTGAARYGPPPRGQTSGFYNSIRVIDSSGTVLQSADKVHLVPFGEYLPFQPVMEAIGFEQLTRQRGGFASGDTLRNLAIPGAPKATPLICYEAIFPDAVLPADGERPGFLLNVTNDAWFGLTPGPYQHFLQARLRTIEEGLPMVRAANTGISAVIDPLGRIVAELSLGRKGNLDVGLPTTLSDATFAGRYRGFGFGLIFVLNLALAAGCVRKR